MVVLFFDEPFGTYYLCVPFSTSMRKQMAIIIIGTTTTTTIYRGKPDNYWLEPAGPLVGKCHLEGNIIENHQRLSMGNRTPVY